MKKLLLFSVILFSLSFAKAQFNIAFSGKLAYNDQLSNLWGWTASDGTEYAVVGTEDGLSVVSLADPTNPVEVYFSDANNSIWREVKTYGNYAYAVSEGGGGLHIIDMSTLPADANLTTYFFTGNTYQFSAAHTLFIDENGVAYIFGADYDNGGAIMLNLEANPTNPPELGTWNEYYIHDGYARNDTLWASCINDGIQATVDVTDKQNPTLLATWATPNNFSHNNWMSDDGNYLFTTDEVSGAYVAAYDIRDLDNVTEIDRYQSSPGQGVIPHNTYYLNEYLITSYYTDGVTIVDATHPHNLIEVGNYDTSPNFAGDGFNGAWGVYPYFESGLIIVSDMEEGLYVLNPSYEKACYFEGSVTDSTCSVPLSGVTIEILGLADSEVTQTDGSFSFGTAIPGTYSVKFSKAGYNDLVISNVDFVSGALQTMNVKLFSPTLVNLSGIAKEGGSESNLNGVNISYASSDNNYTFVSNGSGNYSQCNVVSDTYDINLAKWGYAANCKKDVVVNNSNSNRLDYLSRGYHDDFTFDLGWTVFGTATVGVWERALPKETIYGQTGEVANPGVDYDGDCGDRAYVTGNNDASVSADDVDDGYTTLATPVFDGLLFPFPFVSFQSWFYNGGGFGTVNDYLVISVTNGITTVSLDTIDASDLMSSWQFQEYSLYDKITMTSNMKVFFKAEDVDSGHLLEAGIDEFQITNGPLGEEKKSLFSNEILVYPNPFSDGLNIILKGEGKLKNVKVMDVTGKVVYEIETIQSSLKFNYPFESGMYFVSVKDENGEVFTKKVVKR